MVKLMKNTVFILLGFGLLSSCVPEPLEVDGVPAASSDPVVSTLFLPENSVALLLSRSFGALTEVSDSNQSALNVALIPNAEASISYLDREIILTEEAPGIYTSDVFEAIEDVDYTLNILDTQTGLEVSAVTQYEEQVSFDSISAVTRDFDINTRTVISYSFQDIPNEQNWYMINVQAVDRDFSELFDNVLSSGLYTYTLTDEGKDGEVIDGEFVSFNRFEFEGVDTLIVSLTNISKPYYDFLIEKEDQDFSSSFLSEPFNFSSNVDGGYGFFNLFQSDTRTIFSEIE